MTSFLFYSSLIVLVYIHLLYPILLILIFSIKRLFGRDKKFSFPNRANCLPTISLVVAAYNEESIIEKKIKNCLELDYPKDRYEIIIFSDGSTDETDTIIQKYADLGVKLLRFEGRIGKTACQNLAVNETEGTIIIYSDATSMLNDKCLQSIARKFSDRDVGCVIGKLESLPKSGEYGYGTEESLYLDFLQWLKKLENVASMPVGGSGALFAVRKELTVELPTDANDDLLRPLYVVVRGYKIVYDQESVATEILSLKDHVVFQKKIRIAQRAVTSMLLYIKLLNPLRYGLFSFQFFTKVLLRRMIFPALVVYLISGVVLYIDKSSFLILMLIAPVFVAILLALYGWVLSHRKTAVKRAFQKVSRFCYYYFMSTLGAFIGLLKGFCGFRITKWN